MKKYSFPLKYFVFLSISLYLLVNGLYLGKVLHTKGILAKIPSDSTMPHFEVVFGKFKIGQAKHKASQIVDKNYFWLENSNILDGVENADNPYMYDFYYVFEGEIVGYDAEEELDKAKYIHPKLRITAVQLYSELEVWFYCGITFLSIFSTIRSFKKLILQRKMNKNTDL